MNSVRTDSVAVTVVTHNSEAYIRSCLESVLSQGHPPGEVAIVDNGSRDGTLDAVIPFRERVRLIRNSSNLGFSVNTQADRVAAMAWF